MGRRKGGRNNWRRHGANCSGKAPKRCAIRSRSKIDDREDYGEERVNVLGMRQGVILLVTYTEPGNRIRITSARRATKDEQDDYCRQNAP
jgi:uncharacterized protein